MNNEELHQIIEHLSKMIMDWDGVIQIGYSKHPDALIAAAIFGKTFIDLEQPFVLFNFETQDADLKMRVAHPLILIDFNQEDIPALDLNNIVVLTSSDLNISTENLINIRGYEYAEDEISYSALAYLICNLFAADHSLSAIIQLPLIAVQTLDMMSDYKGIHEIIANDALEAEIIEISKQFAVLGGNLFSITNALVYSEQPFNPGLTGNEVEVTQLLAKAGIPVETSEGERRIIDLNKDELTSLISTLTVHMGRKREYQEKFEILKSKTILIEEEEHTILRNTWDYARAILDCFNRDRLNLALSILLGNRSKQFRDLTKIFREERQALSISFQIIMDRQDQVEDLSKLRYLVTNHKINWYNTSLAAAMGLSSGLVTPDLPFAVIAEGPKDLYTIGLRASTTHKIGSSLKSIVKEVLDERNLNTPITGGEFSVLVSVPHEIYEAVMLDINSKLMEIDI